MATPEQYIPDLTNPLSEKQREVLHVIARGNADGSAVDRDQLMSRLSYAPTMNCVIFILRYMVAQNRVVKVGIERRLRSNKQGHLRYHNVATYRITSLGRSFISADE